MDSARSQYQFVLLMAPGGLDDVVWNVTQDCLFSVEVEVDAVPERHAVHVRLQDRLGHGDTGTQKQGHQTQSRRPDKARSSVGHHHFLLLLLLLHNWKRRCA